jgi:hypothetical protein
MNNTKHDEHDEHDKHKEHDAHDAHKEHDAHDAHNEHDAHDKHDKHNERTIPVSPLPCGKSYTITWVMSFTSNPRAATPVANNVVMRPR